MADQKEPLLGKQFIIYPPTVNEGLVIDAV